MNETSDVPDEWAIDNLPNRLTIFRVILIPIILGSLYLSAMDYEWVLNNRITLGYIAGWTFVVAGITDFLDGYIARKRGIVTVFGSFLDPIADKFLVVSSLILLQELDRIPVLIVIILVLREIYITALRLLAHERELSVPVGKLGKWKTFLQLMAVPMLMPNDVPWGIPMPTIGIVMIYVTTILSIYSALEYSFGLVKKLKEKRKKQKENSP